MVRFIERSDESGRRDNLVGGRRTARRTRPSLRPTQPRPQHPAGRYDACTQRPRHRTRACRQSQLRRPSESLHRAGLAGRGRFGAGLGLCRPRMWFGLRDVCHRASSEVRPCRATTSVQGCVTWMSRGLTTSWVSPIRGARAQRSYSSVTRSPIQWHGPPGREASLSRWAIG